MISIDAINKDKQCVRISFVMILRGFTAGHEAAHTMSVRVKKLLGDS